MEKAITLNIGGMEYPFAVTIADYNNFMNSVQTDSKTAPAANLCRATLADPAKKEDLNNLINSGLALDIAGKLIEEFRPKVVIEVKK